MAVTKRHDVAGSDSEEETAKPKAKPRSRAKAKKPETEQPDKGVIADGSDEVVSELKQHEDLESLDEVPNIDAPPAGDGFTDTFVPGRIAPDYPVNANPDEVLAGRQTKKQAADKERGKLVVGDNAV